MGKSKIIDAFEDKISSTAIQFRYDEWVIKGKFCIVAPDDEDGDVWDIWICNPDDIAAGLSQRRARNIIQALESTGKMEFNELTGEAWGKVSDKNVILGNLKLLGIRKKRVMSPEQASKNAEVLNLARRKIQIDNHLGAT